jgi:hypothetical protein
MRKGSHFVMPRSGPSFEFTTQTWMSSRRRTATSRLSLIVRSSALHIILEPLLLQAYKSKCSSSMHGNAAAQPEQLKSLPEPRAGACRRAARHECGGADGVAQAGQRLGRRGRDARRVRGPRVRLRARAAATARVPVRPCCSLCSSAPDLSCAEQWSACLHLMSRARSLYDAVHSCSRCALLGQR